MKKYFQDAVDPSIGKVRHVFEGESDTSILAKGAGINFLGQVVLAVMVFGTHIALARILGPREYGIYAIGWTILRMSRLVSGLGLERGLVRFGSQLYPDESNRLRNVLWQSFSMTGFFAVVAAILLFFSAPIIANRLFHDDLHTWVVQYFAVSLILVAGLRITATATRITQRMQYNVLTLQVLQPTLNVVLIILFARYLQLGLQGAMAALMISYVLALAVSLIQLRKLFPSSYNYLKGTSLWSKEILIFSLLASMTGLLLKMNTWVDRLFVGYFLQTEDAGIYVAATQISNLFFIVTATFSGIFGPMAARLYAAGNMARLEAIYRLSTKWGLFMSFIFFLVILFGQDAIMVLPFGPDFATGTQPMIILVVAHLLRTLPGAVGILLIMTGNQKQWFVLALITVTFNIVMNIILIPRFGSMGAATGTLLSVILLFSVGLILVKHLLNMVPYDRRYFKGLIAAAVSALVLFGWDRLSPVPTNFVQSLGKLGVSAILATISFFGVILVQGFDREEREILGKVKRRVRRIL